MCVSHNWNNVCTSHAAQIFADVRNISDWFDFHNCVFIPALKFFQRFCHDQEEYRESDLSRLAAVQQPEHMEVDQMMTTFK